MLYLCGFSTAALFGLTFFSSLWPLFSLLGQYVFRKTRSSSLFPDNRKASWRPQNSAAEKVASQKWSQHAIKVFRLCRKDRRSLFEPLSRTYKSLSHSSSQELLCTGSSVSSGSLPLAASSSHTQLEAPGSFTPSLAAHFDDNLIKHIQGWPSENTEKQVQSTSFIYFLCWVVGVQLITAPNKCAFTPNLHPPFFYFLKSPSKSWMYVHTGFMIQPVLGATVRGFWSFLLGFISRHWC